MNRNEVTMLIVSCDKFSDLWEGHVKQLERNWPDRNIDTYIVTESKSEKYGTVGTITAGDAEWSTRLKTALKSVATEYVFLTLDDYFLSGKVDDAKMQAYLDIMKKNSIDYFRFYKRPKRDKRLRFDGSRNLFFIDTKQRYGVNLYPGIWKKDFLLFTLKDCKNAWRYEVSLPRAASGYKAGCMMTVSNDFPILDVVRKGKLLHKSARYFKKHPGIYNGNRKVNTRWFEFRLFVKTWASRLLPKSLAKRLRKFFSRHGYHYFSEEMDNL